jgi:hypothetical protein
MIFIQLYQLKIVGAGDFSMEDGLEIIKGISW